jgi:predicted nucleic acid-binding OB-fold protein
MSERLVFELGEGQHNFDLLEQVKGIVYTEIADRVDQVVRSCAVDTVEEAQRNTLKEVVEKLIEADSCFVALHLLHCLKNEPFQEMVVSQTVED